MGNKLSGSLTQQVEQYYQKSPVDPFNPKTASKAPKAEEKRLKELSKPENEWSVVDIDRKAVSDQGTRYDVIRAQYGKDVMLDVFTSKGEPVMEGMSIDQGKSFDWKPLGNADLVPSHDIGW